MRDLLQIGNHEAIAKATGVHRHTVRKASQGSNLVTPKTQAKLLDFLTKTLYVKEIWMVKHENGGVTLFMSKPTPLNVDGEVLYVSTCGGTYCKDMQIEGDENVIQRLILKLEKVNA